MSVGKVKIGPDLRIGSVKIGPDLRIGSVKIGNQMPEASVKIIHQMPEASGRTKTVTFSYPEHWNDMKGRKILIVDVNEGSKEWQGVEQIFQKTLKKKILVMKRVQNMHFWEPYSLKQRKLEEQYGEGNCNERTLFHGTTPDLAKVIEHQNLDPRIYGTNGTAYGKGTYFAVKASYSDSYASTNKDGHKFMFMASVLTGKFCRGDTSYTRPPPIDTSNKYSPLYDSCVDNINNPSMYCIFHDSQFYIDYLIEYM